MVLQSFRQRARHASPLQAAILLVFLSGCGFGTPAAASSKTTQQQDAQKAMATMNAMTTCLRGAGYRMVGPPTGEANGNFQVGSSNAEADQQMRDDPGYKKAYDKCAASTGFQQLASKIRGRKPSAQQIRKGNQQVLKMYSCMRQKGWTLSDPTKGSDGQLSPPRPPSGVQGAQMSQFGNDLNSCSKAAGMNGHIVTGNGGSGGPGGTVSGGA
jgi:hypothetical protein